MRSALSLASSSPAATSPAATLSCRACGQPLTHVMADLGVSPLCESYLSAAQLRGPEVFYPLCAYVCEGCWLVQVQDFAPPEHIFREYAYFSSYSESWLAHAKAYAEMAARRFGLSPAHRVVEVASNDGYLLRNFVAAGLTVLGIDPARNVAAAAEAQGVPTVTEFFGRALAETLRAEGLEADLMVANNVLAHVPDLHDFIAGFAVLLAPEGVATFEFPHLLRLLLERQFDTIYHEHFSYLSLTVVARLFAEHGLRVFDVEELPSHGGSLRVYAAHAASGHATSDRVAALQEEERRRGLFELTTYHAFGEAAQGVRQDLLRLLLALKAEDKTVVGYGAPGKGNTLLNYCGVRTDLLVYTVDKNPYKQGKYLPGTHIPIYAPERILETRPDYVLILPWNLEREIAAQLAFVREWGGRFIVPIPSPRILP